MTQLSTLIQGSGKNAIDKRSYIATSGQTVFAVIYSPPYVDVYQNGVRLNVVDYTATLGTSVTLTVGAAVNDEIEVIGFSSDASITASYSGSTAPAVPIEGMMWYDTTDGSLYVRTGNFWVEASQAGATQGIQGIQGPPGDGVIISGITVTDASYNNTDDTAVSLTGGYIKVTGTGFVSGCTIVVGTVIATSVTFISSTEVRAQLPALAAGTYILYVSNPSGAVAIRVNAITFSALPTWVSTSPLPNGKLNTAISIQLSGTSDSAVTYALQSGSTLPSGVTLSSSGLLSGTVTGITTDTTYNFTVVATDVELQDSPKAFSITITVLYAVARSLRFRSSASAYLNRTFGTPTNNIKWTWSAWVKRGTLSVATNLLQGYVSTSVRTALVLNSNDTIFFNPAVGGLSTTAVFRDPAAWYHIICVYDSANATAGDRLILYVNGTRQTLTGTDLTPSQVEYINSAGNDHYLASGRIGATFYPTDCELAEVYFVDGQALTAASFGQVSVTSGAWIPKAYAGTYGTNGFYLPFSGGTTTSYAGSFNGSSQYLTVPNDAAFTLGATSTTEAWIYVTSTTNNKRIITNGSNTNSFDLGLYNSTNTVFVAGGNANTTASIPLNTWTHVAVVFNSGTLTIYFNGVSQALSGVTTGYSLVASTLSAVFIGAQNAGSYFPGYISNLRVVKGTAVYTANFIPPTTALTAITNTSLLTLQNATIVDNSTNAFTITNTGTVVTSVQSPFLNPTVLTADSSGNANNWTPNNISLTAGSAYDSMLDSPTPTSATVGNYAVINPLQVATNSTISDGNLKALAVGAGTHRTQYATIGASTGKFYWETTWSTCGGSGGCGIGVGFNQANSPLSYLGIGDSYSYNNYTGQKINNGTATAYGNSWTSGVVIGCAIDMTNGKIWWSKNGTWQASGDPAAGTNAAFTGLTGTFVPAWSFYDASDSYTPNFGQQPFTYTPPAGFLGLNTYNLPASAVPNPATAMAATTYTGTGATLAVSNAVNSVSFQPDLVWTKTRNTATNGFNIVQDSVRGAGNRLITDGTYAEGYDATFGSFTSSGFQFGTNVNVNTSGNTYINWQWKAGGAVSANNNTAGTITSTVSANQAAGFSVVTFTGNGVDTLSGVATVGHGLGVTPSFIITKKRSSGTDYNWSTYHISNGNANIWLNTTSAKNPNNWVTAPAATVFTPPVSLYGNESGVNYVAYCWAPVAGYSAFGKYTGNGSTDGPFIYTGFRPRWFMVKRTDSTSNWLVYDTSRIGYNQANNYLLPDLANAEGSGDNYLDILSNGLKIRVANQSTNTSGGTYIYAAFAESAFNFATAR